MGAGKLTGPWHIVAPGQLENLHVMLAEKFPRLHALKSGDYVLVEGTFDVNEGDVRIEGFLIRVLLPTSYPLEIPTVWELGGRVPRQLDWHVNGNGTLCVGLPEELWLRFKGRFELKEFLEGPVRSYFVGVCEKLAGRPWPWEEWAHGAPALQEFYGKVIGTEDIECVKALLAMLEKDLVKGHWRCPCGSGKEIRRCHLPTVRDLHATLPKWMFTRYLASLNAQADSVIRNAVNGAI
jgi:hypothetical protein